MKKIYSLILFFLWISLISFPIENYDYRNTENNISPIISAMGGLNVAYLNDPFLIYGNPALLSQNKKSIVALSYMIAHDDNDNFLTNASPAALFKDKQFLALCFTQENGGFLYYPLVNTKENNSFIKNDATYKENIEYKLSAYQFSVANTKKDWGIGISLKYLRGEIIYLKKRSFEEEWILEDFVNDNANGFSMDLGFVKKIGNFNTGLALYDIFSKLFWSDNPDRVIQKRFGLSIALQGNDSGITAGISGKIKNKMDKRFHFGYDRSFNLSDPKVVTQKLNIRLGTHSKDFSNQKDIYTSLGIGYYFKQFRFDFSMDNNDMKIKNNLYKLSILIGI